MGLGVEHCKRVGHLGVVDIIDGTVLHLNVKGGLYLL